MKSSLEVEVSFTLPSQIINSKYTSVYFAVTNSEVAPAGLEPATLGLKVQCSAELS